VRQRMAKLLAVFVAASLYLVAVFHVTQLYYARQSAFERFILRDGGLYPLLFWGGYVLLGSVLPMVLLFHPRWRDERRVGVAAACVVAGAFAFLYVFIIGGQAFPLDIFPGHAAASTFGDGVVAAYAPSWPEWLLGIGGLGAAFVLTMVGVRVLDFMPQDDFVFAPAESADKAA
jgi:Ni/Fe-hydrogenase subunit HybB-like protein